MASLATVPLLNKALCSLEDVALHRGFQVGDTDTTYNKDQLATVLINAVTSRIETLTKRVFKRGNPTEYFDGAVYPFSVPLSHYPIVSITDVWDDPNQSYDSALSSSIYNHNNGWLRLWKGGRFSNALKNIKVTYVGGYALFNIESGINDQLLVSDDGVTFVQATVLRPTEGQYHTAETLATAIKTAIEATAITDTITVTYGSGTRKFTIASDGSTFEIKSDTTHASWTNRNLEFASLIGQNTAADTTEDHTGALTYTMPNEVGEVPDDLRYAAVEWVAFLFEETGGDGGGANRFGVSGTGGDRTAMQYFLREPPKRVKEVVMSYAAGML